MLNEHQNILKHEDQIYLRYEKKEVLLEQRGCQGTLAAAGSDWDVAGARYRAGIVPRLVKPLENSSLQLLIDSDEETDNEGVLGAPDGLLADAVESSDDEDSGGESDASIRKRAPQSATYQSNYIGSETAFLTAA
uniref:Uncharacterized protein n=1 Tax=Haemonchus contortus TaxID=6289 RepID=A0A7I4Y5K1_HAECO